MKQIFLFTKSCRLFLLLLATFLMSSVCGCMPDSTMFSTQTASPHTEVDSAPYKVFSTAIPQLVYEYDGKTYNSEEEVEEAITDSILQSLDASLGASSGYQKSTDGLTFVKQQISAPKHNYYEPKFTVKNTSGGKIHTISLLICMLDENGDILDSTYKQVPTTVNNGQSITIGGMVAVDLGATSAQLNGYSYYNESGTYFKGSFDYIEPLKLDSYTNKPTNDQTPHEDHPKSDPPVATPKQDTDTLFFTEKRGAAQIAYDTALDLTVSQLTNKGYNTIYDENRYSFGFIPIVMEDVAWIDSPFNSEGTVDQGAPYRGIAQLLMGLFDNAMYRYWGDSLFPTVFNMEKPNSVDEFLPYYERTKPLFVIADNAKECILNCFKKLPCIEGTLRNDHCDFVITDIAQASDYFGLTETAFGYVLAVFDEYSIDVDFDGNSCTVKG